MNSVQCDEQDLLLTGLDGSNPLAFMAALGVCNVLNDKLPIRMRWTMDEGVWRPLLIAGDGIDCIVELLGEFLSSELKAPWNLSKKLPFDAASLRIAMIRELANDFLANRTTIDTFAAFGSEVYVDEKGQFQDTAFRMVRSGDSAGQGLPDYACKLAANCEATDIAGALFGPWTYSASLSSFRWDPAENREYALQAINPSKDAAPTAVGVNRLALAALPLYPTMPGASGLETVGFIKGSRSKDAEFRWPIWTVPLGLDSIRSLLTYPTIFDREPSVLQLREMGVAAVFCCRQIKPNQYYRNFSPSFQL